MGGRRGPLFLRLTPLERAAVPLTLLQRVAAADAAAVDECLSTYSGLVWSLARRWCSRHEDAEDAVQDIFIEIWRVAGTYNPEFGSESNYIAMIAKRRLIDRYRRRGREIETTLFVEESVSAEADHEKQAEISEEVERARGYMRELRPEEQRVLELAINDGLSQSEIAHATDLPLGTVKTHSRRGLVRLRELLGVQSEKSLERGGP